MSQTPPKTTTQQAVQIAAIIGVGVVALNVAFFFLSDSYFHDHLDAVNVSGVRGAFGVLTGIVGVASFLAALAPRLVGHALAAIVAVCSLVAGVAALNAGLPNVMGMTLLVLGVVVPLLVWQSLLHSRAAWSFLIAIMAVFATVDFFGAPKVRGLLGIGLWTALIVPGLQIVSAIALAMIRSEYREGAADSKSVLPTKIAAQ
ncbi:MAG: hypothetical protein JWO36_7455 [Myxococcales bacterium]|nr:hypothetical protein [Myxococcales bacterium]